MSTEKSIPAAARNHGGREKESRIIGMFSYGSNNQQQLRARVKSPALRGYPAHLDGYVRVFGSDSLSWGGGSVASVAPKEGGRVYGRFYCMTPQEVVILDLYEHVKEGNYLKEAVMVNVCVQASRGQDAAEKDTNEGTKRGRDATSNATSIFSSSSSSNNNNDDDDDDDNNNNDNGEFVMCSAITYVMAQRYAQTFVQPSPQYLTAVHRTLIDSFPELRGGPIEILDYTGSKISEWVYPGSKALPLKAFLVEVGLQEEQPWKYPYVLDPMISRLSDAGIVTTKDLCDAAVDGVLLSRLESAVTYGLPQPLTRSEEEQDEQTEKPGAEGLGSTMPPSTTLTPSTVVEIMENSRKWVDSVIIPNFTQKTVDIIMSLAS